MKPKIICFIILFICLDIHSQNNAKQYPIVWVKNCSPSLPLELPKSLKHDSITGDAILEIYISADKLRIKKIAILKFELRNVISDKVVFLYSQLGLNCKKIDYNWNHYPLIVKEYRFFLSSYLNGLELIADYSPTQILHNRFQRLTCHIDFK